MCIIKVYEKPSTTSYSDLAVVQRAAEPRKFVVKVMAVIPFWSSVDSSIVSLRVFYEQTSALHIMQLLGNIFLYEKVKLEENESVKYFHNVGDEKRSRAKRVTELRSGEKPAAGTTAERLHSMYTIRLM